MINELLQISGFFIQTIIIVAAILITVAGILAIASKGKLKKSKIKVKKLNQHFKEMADTLNEEILDKTERKKRNKADKKAKKKNKKEKKVDKKRLFVLNFQGDIKATAVNSLREEISALLTVATPQDEVLLRLESAGGVVHGYGLAASELQRIKDQSIPLTIAIDKVAASGGYMMACIANKILAAPFAIIGSIGVVAQLPNFNKLLKKHNVDFEQITAGQYKRTLTLFGENTPSSRQKVQDEVNEVHKLFKDFIKEQRPQVDLEQVATGEYWHAKKALDLKLVDTLRTSDDYLLEANKDRDIFEITYKKKKSFLEKIHTSAQMLLNKEVNYF